MTVHNRQHNGRQKMPAASPPPASEVVLSDDALMARIAAGDHAAFAKLVNRHLGRVVRVAIRILGSRSEAEDAAQEVFIRIWRSAPDWKNSGNSGAKFTTWMHRVVVNLCVDLIRKKKHDSWEEVPEQEDDSPSADEHISAQQTAGKVRAALKALPERQRTAMVLNFYEGLSNKEAAEAMGISVKALESLLVRARKTLREHLEDEIMIYGGRQPE